MVGEVDRPIIHLEGGFYSMMTEFNRDIAKGAVGREGLRLGTAAEAVAYIKAGHPHPEYWVAMGRSDPYGRFLCWVNNTVGFKLCNNSRWVAECALFVVIG